MRTSVLCLAATLAVCSVLPFCCARPNTYVKKQSAQSACSASSAESASSETVVKQGACGSGSVVASKKNFAKSVSSSASSSSSSYEAISTDGCLSEVEIKQRYAQQEGESALDYYKRIVSRSYEWTSTTKTYLKTLSIVWKDFCTLDLWYDKKYIDIVKEFYNLYYGKEDSETWDSYYSRLVKKQTWETDYYYARRMAVIQDCFPQLDLWTSDEWFDKYTRTLYALQFKQSEKESEVDYIKRIFEKDELFDTTDEMWAKRIFYIQKATISCPVWYNEAYISYFTKFYKIWYQKKESESCDAWLLRALTPFPGESLDNALKRITFIKKVTGDCGCWKLDYFNKILAAKSLEESWLVKVQKSFFLSSSSSVTVERSVSSSTASTSTKSGCACAKVCKC